MNKKIAETLNKKGEKKMENYEACWVRADGYDNVNFRASGNLDEIWEAAEKAMKEKHGHSNVSCWQRMSR